MDIASPAQRRKSFAFMEDSSWGIFPWHSPMKDSPKDSIKESPKESLIEKVQEGGKDENSAEITQNTGKKSALFGHSAAARVASVGSDTLDTLDALDSLDTQDIQDIHDIQATTSTDPIDLLTEEIPSDIPEMPELDALTPTLVKLDNLSVAPAAEPHLLNQFNTGLSDVDTKDWMLRFESPLKRPTTYTQQDIDEITRNLKQQFEQEFSLAQLEIQESAQKSSELMSENRKIKQTLEQWEQAVKREKDKEDANEEIDALKAQLEEVEQTRSTLKDEISELKLKYNQVRLDSTDLKESLERKTLALAKAEQEIQQANQKFETLKQNAEKKLDDANIEIARVRQGYEKENAALKAKLARLEINVNTLERTLENKVQENIELNKICDGLLKQIDSK